MTDVTLEALARRVEALERAVAGNGLAQPRRDWRSVIGMFADCEFMRTVDEECLRSREAEREVARHEDAPA